MINRLLVTVVLVATFVSSGMTQGPATAVAWTPASITSLKLWLDASDASTFTTSGSSITQWRDKSGNGYHANGPAGNQPTLAANSVYINGSQYLTGSMPAGTLGTSVQVTTVFKTCTCGLSSYQAMPFNRTMNNFPTPFDGYENSLLVGGPTGSYSGWSSFTNIRSDTTLMVLSTSMSATKVQQYRNGTLVDTKTGAFPYQDMPSAYHVATRYDRVTQFRGDIHEIVVTSELSNADRVNLEQYLAAKWTVSGVPTTTTSTSTTTTSTTTTTTTTTTVPPSTTTAAPTTTVTGATTTAPPALEIQFSAPTTTAPPAQPVTGSTVSVTASTVALRSATASSLPLASATPAPTSTTSTLPNNAGGTVPRPVPKVQAVAAGEAGVRIGEKVQQTTVTRLNNQLVVSAGPLKAEFGSLDPSGAPAALDAEGGIRLRSGDAVRIRLTGFEPGSTVEAWLFSTPQLMGTAKVGDDGSVVGTFRIPQDVEAGPHRIAVVARTEDGKPATLTVGVKVGDWEKESSVAVWLIELPIVLAVAGALTLPATRRRRRSSAS